MVFRSKVQPRPYESWCARIWDGVVAGYRCTLRQPAVAAASILIPLALLSLASSNLLQNLLYGRASLEFHYMGQRSAPEDIFNHTFSNKLHCGSDGLVFGVTRPPSQPLATASGPSSVSSSVHSSSKDGKGQQGGKIQKPRSIPLLATNVDFDTQGFLTRLFSSLDYPTDHKLIAVGGCEAPVVSQLSTILEQQPDIRVFHSIEFLGCAPGWNAAMRYMAYHDDIPWAVVVNSDIYAPPGSLANISEAVWAHVEANPTFCLGYFNVIAGPEFAAFVITRHALAVVGFFDENIYPAYYEDRDYQIRIERAIASGACSMNVTFDVPLIHGSGTAYQSGSYVTLDKMLRGGQQSKNRALILAKRLERSKAAGHEYVCNKWGCPKSRRDIDFSTCKFDRPFNNPALPISYWHVDRLRRQCIDGDINQSLRFSFYRWKRVCQYTLEDYG